MSEKQSDIQTILYLIKSESEQTRKELTELFTEKISGVEYKLKKEMNKGFENQKSDLRKEMNKGFENQKQELKEYLDDKFENHRRQIVNEIQNFQDFVIKDNLAINQELAVNSSRLSKVEKHVFAN